MAPTSSSIATTNEPSNNVTSSSLPCLRTSYFSCSQCWRKAARSMECQSASEAQAQTELRCQ